LISFTYFITLTLGHVTTNPKTDVGVAF